MASSNIIGSVCLLLGVLVIVLLVNAYSSKKRKKWIRTFLEDLYAGKHDYIDIQAFATTVSAYPIKIFEGIDTPYTTTVQRLQDILRTRGDIHGGGRPIKEKISEYFANRESAIMLAKTEIETFLNCERKKS
jgi:hypothetical protein